MAHTRHILRRPRSRADRVADVVGGLTGRWVCVLLHAVIYGVWLKTSLFGLDPFPHGLLTMTVAIEGMFLGLFILMGQKRRVAVERARDDLEEAEVLVLQQTHEEQQVLMRRLGEDLALLRNEHRALHDRLQCLLEQQKEEP